MTSYGAQLSGHEQQSEPVQVTVAAVQPAIFTTNAQGTGQGEIFWTTPEGSVVLADVDNPVAAGS